MAKRQCEGEVIRMNANLKAVGNLAPRLALRWVSVSAGPACTKACISVQARRVAMS